MPSQKFSRDQLLERILNEDYVRLKITGKSRWSIHYEMIFEFGGKFFRTNYSEGATEYQSEEPYEYETEIYCIEVVPYEKNDN